MRTVIVGCGNIAGGFDASRPTDQLPFTHAGAYRRHGGFELAACIEPDRARRDAFMARWDIPQGFDDLQSLPIGSVDVISICSPTSEHAAHIEAALQLRPRAIFCEKPLTPSFAESSRWAGACEEQGVALAVNHTRRWAPDVRELAQQLHRGDWGAVRSAVGWYGKGVLNNGSHLIDLLLWLLGPLQVQWAGPPVQDFWRDDPTVAAILCSDAGVPVHLAPSDARDYSLFELQLVTQRGVLCMDRGGMAWRRRQPQPHPDFPGYMSLSDDERSEGLYAGAMLAAVTNLHDCVARGEPLLSTGRNALRAQALCESIRTMSMQHPRAAKSKP
jgi:predicted dehydrogenase